MKTEFLQMDELSNKFIIMSRIAVSLHNNGLVCSVTLHDTFCNMFVHFFTDETTCDVVEGISSSDITEQELLEWWDAIEKTSK